MPLTSVTSHTDLQSNFDRLDKWDTQWGMSFNNNKFHVLHSRSNNPRHVYMLENYSPIAVNSADDLSLLREATSPGRYDLHIQRTIKKLHGAPYLILRGLSSHRVNIRHKVFVSYIRLIEFAAVL